MAGKTSFGIDNAVVGQFIFYALIVLLKMMLMSFITVIRRNLNQVFCNPEDLKLATRKDVKVTLTDPDVERVRRCHLNDLENIIPFVFVGIFYCLTGPNPYYAAIHFRLFAFVRLFHSVAYLTPLPQPSRALGFIVGWFVTASMAISALSTVAIYM